MLRKRVARRRFSCGKGEADEERGRPAGQQREQDLGRHECRRRHRGVVGEPASRHLVERLGERQRADDDPDENWLAPAYASFARISDERDDTDDREPQYSHGGKQREELIPRTHLAIPPPERLGNLDERAKPGRSVAGDDRLGADGCAADAAIHALEGVGAVDATAVFFVSYDELTSLQRSARSSIQLLSTCSANLRRNPRSQRAVCPLRRAYGQIR